MKNFVLSIILMLTFLCGSIHAQGLIAVQNGGAPTFYQQVDSAIVHAQDGDTIYIPGGSWNITKTISKRLHMIGAGHNPDSTNALGETWLFGFLDLTTGSSYSSFTGLNLKYSLRVLTNQVISCSFSRCRFASGISLYASNNNFSFIENVFESNIGASAGSSSSCAFYNNIFAGYISFSSGDEFKNSLFKNNIFLKDWYAGGPRIIGCRHSLVENNIFKCTVYTILGASNSTFKNNLFCETITFPSQTNVGSNNIVSQPSSSIFINQSGTTFNYAHDYHLKSSCPGKNAGTDGTDMGIYGGVYPWKEGSVPFNPHIQSASIPGTTDQNGNLNVNIKVAAQDH